MFSLLFKIVSGSWSWISSPSPAETHQEKTTNKDSEHFLTNLVFKGVITHINTLERYGIIDKTVYFHFDSVYAGLVPSLNCPVLAHASREEAHHAWICTSVQLLKEHWNNKRLSNMETVQPTSNVEIRNQTVNRSETFELIVTECNSKFGKLEGDWQFSVEDGEVEFQPATGDLLIASVVLNCDGKKVVSWKPKEIKCVEGVVTACENECGVINDEIVFLRSSCQYRVRIFVGRKVSAMVTSSSHGLFKWRAFSLSSSFVEGEVDSIRKACVTRHEDLDITDPLNFENVYLGQENNFTVILQNNTADDITLIDCHFQNERHSPFFLAKSDVSMLLVPKNTSLSLTIHCKTEAIGQHEDYLLFEFSEYIIKRYVTVNIVDPIQNILKPTAPFSFQNKNSRKIDSDDLVIIPGEKHFKPGLTFCNKLPPCPIPRNLLKSVENRVDLTCVVPCLFQNLTVKNYVQKFKTLLHLEEIQMRFDMKRFDMLEVILQKRGEFLCLEVPGLAEGRPSLVIGDKAILIPPYGNSEFAFEGYIHEVHQDNVLLKFNDGFHSSYDGESYDAHFQFSRTNFRRLHQCVHHAWENHNYAIFPSSIKLKKPLVQVGSSAKASHKSRQKDQLKPLSSKSVKWKNSKLNWKQKEAVLRILEGRCRPLPYIIFGPPGTGKTVTLVEAVLQVYLNIPDSKIIVCTPSNSAADLVAQRILESDLVGTSEMVRLNSYQRNIDTVPDFIQPFCQDKNHLETITVYRIVISTCSTAGSLYTIGLCNDFFTHVFIDEAGQLMEPESMVAVGFVDFETQGQVVMAGDPQQLGPVLRSSYSKTHGLQLSYLERLMQTALYARDEKTYGDYGGYNPLLITMLVDSYRSHPDILRFPSETFYFSQVICCVPSERHCVLSQWEVLPHPGFPVIFHGVKGEEFREENSPSWFNPTEVVQVTNYLKKLYSYGLTSDDVGIIAPYKKQVEKIRVLMSAFSLEFCKIGSVEEFQGQERRAIIISTVRSCDQYVNCDILYNLGFISNPKRLNVAITRAQELLIVIGNPNILSKDYFWHSFIRYCVVNGCYTGCKLPLSFGLEKSSDV